MHACGSDEVAPSVAGESVADATPSPDARPSRLLVRAPLDDAARAERDFAAWTADEAARAALDEGRAADALSEVEAFFEGPLGDPARAVPLLLVGAEAAARLAQWERFDAWIAAADELIAELGDEWPYRAPFAAATLQARARHSRALGRPDEAARHLAAAQEIARASGDSELATLLSIETANLWLAADEHHALEAHVDAALRSSLFEAVSAERSALELCRATSLVVRGRDEPKFDGDARAMLEALIARDVFLPGDRARALLRLVEVDLRAQRCDAAHDGVERARAELAAGEHGGDHFARGLLAMLDARVARSRARLVGGEAEASLLRSAHERLTREFSSRLAIANGAPLLDDGVGLLHLGEERGLLSELISLEVALEADGPARALAHVANVHALATRHRRAGRVAPIECDAAAFGIAEHGGLLVYVTGIDASHLFLVDARGTSHFELPAVAHMNAARSAFEAAFEPRRGDALPAAEARALADVLLPPDARESMRSWRSCAIVGLDLLRYVPFEVLPWQATSTLGAELAVSYQPDLVTAAALARRAPPERSDAGPLVVCVAAPRLAAPLEPLALTAEQVERLAAGTVRSRVDVVAGAAADARALERACASGALVLHVVTHGVEVGGATALALAGAAGTTALFGAREVEALPRVPPLVILSACRTGDVGRLGEAGLDGLAGAFLERGAQCVLVPYTDVELAAVLELVAEFQERLLAGEVTVAEALRLARATAASDDGARLLHAVGRGNLRFESRR
jgi:hypothetical protein